jgi:hypothetical protein
VGEPLSASPRSQRQLCVPPADKPTLKISFVLPNKKIDVTPQQPADYSKPALPPPREQKIDKEKGNVDRVQTIVHKILRTLSAPRSMPEFCWHWTFGDFRRGSGPTEAVP